MEADNNNYECCPPFDPAPWHEKRITWNNKKFVKASVRTFFYIPLNFGNVIKKVMKKTDDAKALCPDWLCLSDHTSKWNMDIYVAVDKEIPDAENVTLSGNYYSKVYEGKFSETKNWCLDFEKTNNEQGRKIEKWYMWYTVCPKCAKKYGKNHVVIIGKTNN